MVSLSHFANFKMVTYFFYQKMKLPFGMLKIPPKTRTKPQSIMDAHDKPRSGPGQKMAQRGTHFYEVHTNFLKHLMQMHCLLPRTHKICDIKNFWTKFCPNLTILVSLESWRRDLSKFGKTKLRDIHNLPKSKIWV